MQHNCAWCGKDLGAKGPRKKRVVAKTICAGCAERLAQYRKPVLVVSRSRARLYDELFELLRDRDDIQLILDRRGSASAGAEHGDYHGPDRRQNQDPLVLR